MKRECVLASCLLAAGMGYGYQRATRVIGPQPPVVDPGGPVKPPSDAVVLFSGKDNSGWTRLDGTPSRCTVADGVMTCKTGALDTRSTETFRSAQIHVEFLVPNEADQKGYARANSGILLQNEYEIQILDDYKNYVAPDSACAALYRQSPPLVNACRPPGEWQSYDMIYHAPKCGADNKMEAPGSLTLLHNGVLAQDHVPVKTPEWSQRCVSEGPWCFRTTAVSSAGNRSGGRADQWAGAGNGYAIPEYLDAPARGLAEDSRMLNRRVFMTSALGTAAAATASGAAASDQVVVGYIGVGGRAQRHLIPSFKIYDHVRIAALCDVYKPALDLSATLAGDKVDTYGDYRRVLDRKDIDVVVIATPNHWHCPMVIAACEAGKDVYVEKPLSNEIDGCVKAVAAARKHQRVVQVGLQQRSSAPFLEAHKVLRSGILGKVRHVVVVNPSGSVRPAGSAAASGGRRADADASSPPPDLDWEMFQGPAPRRPYSRQRQQNWRNYWEYGCGGLSDWGVHLLDIAHWYMGVTEPSRSAAAVYGWINHAQDDRLPDTIDVSWQYPHFVANYSSRSDVIGTYLWGDEGVLFVNRYGYSVRPVTVNWRGGGGKPPFEEKSVELRDELPPSKASLESDEAKHIRNFLECVKSRQRPVADIEIGAVSTIPTLMGGMSIRSGGKTIAWNGHAAAPMA